MKWEEIKTEHAESMFRTPVFGGWLVKIVQEVASNGTPNEMEFGNKFGYEWRSSITFMPDPKHQWDPEVDYVEQSKEWDQLRKEYLDNLSREL